MHLTDREKEELKRLIDAREPLPAKYKLRLFADLPAPCLARQAGAPEVELIWQGKTSEVTSVVLPFQSIEQIDEPRRAAGSERSADIPVRQVRAPSPTGGQECPRSDALRESYTPLELGLQFDARGRQQGGWTNKLIWGDNKLILSALKNGPVRRDIEAAGGLKLIYIDPPFDVGADFSVNLEVGEETLTKEPSVIEELAYRDTWGKGTDSDRKHEVFPVEPGQTAPSRFQRFPAKLNADLPTSPIELNRVANSMTDVIVECRGGVVQEVTVVGEPARVIVLDWDEFEREPDKAEIAPWPVQRGVTTLAPETRAAYERLRSTPLA